MGKNHSKKLERTEFAHFDRCMAKLKAEQDKYKISNKKEKEKKK